MFSVKLWDVQSGKLLKVFDDTSNQSVVAFNSNGTILATSLSGGFIKLIDVKSGKILKNLKGDAAAIRDIIFSPDGAMMASFGGRDRTIKLWDVQSGRLLDTIKGHRLFFGSLAFSPDGNRLASGYNKNIKLWDISSCRKLLSNTNHTSIDEQKPLSVQNGIPGKNSGKIDQTTRGKSLQGVAMDDIEKFTFLQVHQVDIDTIS